MLSDLQRACKKSHSAGVNAAVRTTVSVLALTAILAGCGGSGSTTNLPPGLPPPLPSPKPSAQVNSYLGTAGTQTPSTGVVTSINYPGGVWTLTLNDAEATFSYHTSTNFTPTGTAPFQGTMAAPNGFSTLTQTNGNPGATQNLTTYALEIPGRAALLRPQSLNGDPSSSSPPVVLVQQSGCLETGGGITFQFVTLPDSKWDPLSERAYGSLLATASGVNWTFSNLNEHTLAGGAINTPPLHAGLCNGGVLGFAVNVPRDSANHIPPTTIEIGPSGFFVADQTDQSGNPVLPEPQGGLPARVGVIQPSAPLLTSDVAGGKYLGFFFEPSGAVTTQLISFGQVPGTATALKGGLFPNDDPSQAPAGNISIDLGGQDPANQGLYPSATLTLPDVLGNCAFNHGTPGKDANGNPTCTMPAAAVVGNPENKFAIFVISQDLASSSLSNVGIYLYQQ